jgi:hypothetical protein
MCVCERQNIGLAVAHLFDTPYNSPSGYAAYFLAISNAAMSKSGSDQRVLVYAYSKQYNAVRHALAVRRDERTIVISHVPHMVSERTVHKWLVADDDGDDEYIAVSVVDGLCPLPHVCAPTYPFAENVATNDDFNPVHVRSAARNVQVCLTTDALANEVWQNKLMSVEHAAALPPRIEPDCAHRVFLVGGIRRRRHCSVGACQRNGSSKRAHWTG